MSSAIQPGLRQAFALRKACSIPFLQPWLKTKLIAVFKWMRRAVASWSAVGREPARYRQPYCPGRTHSQTAIRFCATAFGEISINNFIGKCRTVWNMQAEGCTCQGAQLKKQSLQRFARGFNNSSQILRLSFLILNHCRSDYHCENDSTDN